MKQYIFWAMGFILIVGSGCSIDKLLCPLEGEIVRVVSTDEELSEYYRSFMPYEVGDTLCFTNGMDERYLVCDSSIDLTVSTIEMVNDNNPCQGLTDRREKVLRKTLSEINPVSSLDDAINERENLSFKIEISIGSGYLSLPLRFFSSGNFEGQIFICEGCDPEYHLDWRSEYFENFDVNEKIYYDVIGLTNSHFNGDSAFSKLYFNKEYGLLQFEKTDGVKYGLKPSF